MDIISDVILLFSALVQVNNCWAIVFYFPQVCDAEQFLMKRAHFRSQILDLSINKTILVIVQKLSLSSGHQDISHATYWTEAVWLAAGEQRSHSTPFWSYLLDFCHWMIRVCWANPWRGGGACWKSEPNTVFARLPEEMLVGYRLTFTFVPPLFLNNQIKWGKLYEKYICPSKKFNSSRRKRLILIAPLRS